MVEDEVLADVKKLYYDMNLKVLSPKETKMISIGIVGTLKYLAERNLIDVKHMVGIRNE